MELALNVDAPATDETVGSAARSPETSQTFGPYQTLRVLGEGGMGIVYLAEQREPIQRRVALKVIRLGMDSREVIARFESERQALALMDHPNIARVLDAGTSAAGRLYFVMEYVPGIPITEYCDQHRLNSRERLGLFCVICQAIQHAHQKGVIHRDIKPSNILVEVVDGKPLPKVIDFGVAKAINQPLTEKTLFTQMGVLIGTPAYMSPEQAGLAEMDIDTRTDIYSLGVVLYELLVGALPFAPAELRQAGHAEICRVIREEEPPKPSTKLESLGATGTEVAKRRHTDVRTLVREVRGDLEWITMKALEKDRLRRYATASEFAADIQRHLDDEPVMASPPGVLYRTRKFLRKHRVGVTAVGAILLVSLAGAAASTAEFLNARRQKEAAQWQSYVANIAAADAHLRAGELTAAQQRLLQCETWLRGWEWRYLWARSDSSIATLYLPSNTDVASIGFSRDGRQLLFASADRVDVWNAVTFTPVTTYRNLRSVLEMSPDGTRVLTAGAKEDEPLELLDPASRTVVFTIAAASGHGAKNTMTCAPQCIASTTPATSPAVAFSKDSTLVAAALGSRGIWVWNTASGKRLAVLTGNPTRITALRFTADGALLASGEENGGVRVWDVRSSRLLATFSGKESVAGLEFSPNGNLLAAGGKDGAIQVWNVRAGRIQVSAKGASAKGTGSFAAMVFSPDGSRLAFGIGTSLEVWEWPSGLRRLDLSLESDQGVSALAFTPDNNRLLVAAGNRLVELLDAQSGKQLDVLSGARGMFALNRSLLALNPESNLILAYTGEPQVRAWKIPKPPVRIAFDPDSADEWSLSESHVAHIAKNRLFLWEVGSSAPLAAWDGRPGFKKVLLSPDGTLLAAISDRNQIVVWNVATGATLAQFTGTGAEILNMVFSRDGWRIAASDDKTTRVWDVKSGGLIATIPVFASDLALNPDGSRLVLTKGSFNGAPIQVFDTATGRLLVTADAPRLPRPGGYFFTADGIGNAAFSAGDVGVVLLAPEFSPDGKWIANGEMNRPGVWLRDSVTGSLVSTLAVGDVVWKLGFTADSRRLAAATRGGITIWDPNRREALLPIRGCSPYFAMGANRLVCLALEGSAFSVQVTDLKSSYYPGAEERVDALFQQHFLVSEVVKSLEDDKTMDGELRQAAVATARRHPDDLSGLRDWARGILAEPSADKAQYQLAFDRLRAADPEIEGPARWDRGAWRYRLGMYPEALSALTQNNDDDFERIAFLAMTFERLGRHPEALAQLARLKQRMPNAQPAASVYGRLMQEAQGLIEGSGKK